MDSSNVVSETKFRIIIQPSGLNAMTILEICGRVISEFSRLINHKTSIITLQLLSVQHLIQ